MIIIGWIVLALLAYIIYTKIISTIFLQWYYEKQGVKFSTGIFSLFKDTETILRLRRENPTCYPFLMIMDELFPGKKKPPIVGCPTFSGDVMLIINCPKVLEDVYT